MLDPGTDASEQQPGHHHEPGGSRTQHMQGVSMQARSTLVLGHAASSAARPQGGVLGWRLIDSVTNQKSHGPECCWLSTRMQPAVLQAQCGCKCTSLLNACVVEPFNTLARLCGNQCPTLRVPKLNMHTRYQHQRLFDCHILTVGFTQVAAVSMSHRM